MIDSTDEDDIFRILLLSDRQCGLAGFTTSDFVFGPHVMNGSVARSVEEADAMDADMPEAVRMLLGSTRDRMAQVDSVRYADVTFMNGWKVSAIAGLRDPNGQLAVGGDASVPTYEVSIRCGHVEEMMEPKRHIDVDRLDRILREAQAAPDVRQADRPSRVQ